MVYLVLQATLLVVKKPLCVSSAFLGKCASITAVDLIQWKKIWFVEGFMNLSQI